MKKLVHGGVFFGIVALVLLLAVGAAVAAEHEGEMEVEPTFDFDIDDLPEPVAGEEGQAVEPWGTATRINFEQSEDSAREGWYVVKAVGGAELAVWYALDGWEDSGWINNLDLYLDSVWVQVLYYSGPGVEPVEMKILNHAPGKAYGWLSRGAAHALEVEFPD